MSLLDDLLKVLNSTDGISVQLIDLSSPSEPKCTNPDCLALLEVSEELITVNRRINSIAKMYETIDAADKAQAIRVWWSAVNVPSNELADRLFPDDQPPPAHEPEQHAAIVEFLGQMTDLRDTGTRVSREIIRRHKAAVAAVDIEDLLV